MVAPRSVSLIQIKLLNGQLRGRGGASLISLKASVCQTRMVSTSRYRSHGGADAEEGTERTRHPDGPGTACREVVDNYLIWYRPIEFACRSRATSIAASRHTQPSKGGPSDAGSNIRK